MATNNNTIRNTSIQNHYICDVTYADFMCIASKVNITKFLIYDRNNNAENTNS